MVTVWDVKRSESTGLNETPIVLVELKGLSTDTKPKVIGNANILNGSTFTEIDTGDIYSYDGKDEEWIITQKGNVSEETPTNNEK